MKLQKLSIAVFLLAFMCCSPVQATIKVGTVMFYPPFVISTQNGFDIDLMQLLCKRMNQQCQFVSMDFYQLFPALDNGEIDIALGGITAFPSNRIKGYIFSLPYLLSKAEFMVKSDGKIKSLMDLEGKKVGVMKERNEGGGMFYTFLKDHYQDDFQIAIYNDMEDLISALSSGEIQAAFTHESTVSYWKQNGAGRFKALDKAQIIGNGISIMSVPSHQPLINQLNTAIKQLEETKDYMTLYNRYFYEEH